MKTGRSQHPFTVAEMIAASVVIVVVVASVMPITLQTLKSSYVAKIKGDLRVQLAEAREWLHDHGTIGQAGDDGSSWRRRANGCSGICRERRRATL